MVLPAVEPLDAVIELFEEARRRLVELFVDLAEEPAVRRLPSSVDELTDEGAVELGRLRGRLEALREQAPLDLASRRGRPVTNQQRWRTAQQLAGAPERSGAPQRCC